MSARPVIELLCEQTNATLRDELFALIGHVEFQNATTQHLAHTAAVLTETENRLAELATVPGPRP